MAQNDKADFRKITGAVEDAVTYPILTRDVTSPPSEGTGVSGPSGGSSLDSIAQSTIRQLLGWRYRADDTTGFLAALTKTIQLKEVEGHIEWDVQPQTYMVQADLGEVTGAQASIYARAQVALDQSLPLLNGLTLLGVPTADPEDMEAIRAIIQTEFTALVNELGVVGGPRVQRIDSFFSQLLGPTPVAPIPPPPPDFPGYSSIQLVTLAYRFGLKRTNVNTIDDEQDYTNYLILYDYIYSLYQTWTAQRAYFTGIGHLEPYLGTELVLISQALDALEESVQEAYDAMDSVFFGASDRQATELHLNCQPLITVAELFSWVEDFATNEGLQLIQEGGKDGVVAFRTTINQLEYLIFLTMTESRAHSRNPVHGFHTARVYRALENVQKYLHVTEREADKIQRDSAPPPPVILPSSNGPFSTSALMGQKGVMLTMNCANILPTSGSSTQNASMPQIWIISEDKPTFGIPGYSISITAPQTTTTPPTPQTITATFTDSKSEAPLGEYIVVVQNPDGQYGWLKNALMIVPATGATGGAAPAQPTSAAGATGGAAPAQPTSAAGATGAAAPAQPASAAAAPGAAATAQSASGASMVISKVTPASAAPGAKESVVRIYGQNFVSGATINLGADITVTNAFYLNEKEYLGTFYVAPRAKVGWRDVTLTVQGSSCVLMKGFRVK